MIESPKFCCGCRHHQFDISHGGDVCVRPQMDLVLGGHVDRPMPLDCYAERRHPSGVHCGPDARFFEAKP